jgi:hypothetical protein
MAELQRQDQVEDRQAVGDGPVLPGEHENEVHWASAASPKIRRPRLKTATKCNPCRLIIDKIAQYATFCNNLIFMGGRPSGRSRRRTLKGPSLSAGGAGMRVRHP